MTDTPSLDRRIAALAIPAAGSAMLLVLHRVVDMFWVGEAYGHEEIAALTISTVAVWMFAALGWLVGMGLTSLVARYVGAAREDAARYVASQGLRWSFATGLVAGAIGCAAAPLFFDIAGAGPRVRDAGIPYARLYWSMGGVTLLKVAGDAVFHARGDTGTPFRIGVAALALNAIVDPILIVGWGPIPALGVTGAAIATVLAHAWGAWWIYRAARSRGWLRKSHPGDEPMRLDPTTRLGRPNRLGLDGSVYWRMTRVGLPTGLAALYFNIIYLVMLDAVNLGGGAAAQAGLGIGHNGEGFAFVMYLGWSAAAASLVGRFMGAGDIAGAERAAWRACLQCAGVSLIWSVILFCFHEPIAHIFAQHNSADPAAAYYGAQYMFIVSFCLVPQALELVLDGAFGGAGLTLPPMVIGIVFSTIRVPLAYWAVDAGHGVIGIWWVIAITAMIRGVICALWFARGTWKTRTV